MDHFEVPVALPPGLEPPAPLAAGEQKDHQTLCPSLLPLFDSASWLSSIE